MAIEPASIKHDASQAAVEPATGSSYKNLLELIKDGGPMMIPLFACSFITLVFVFERAISPQARAGHSSSLRQAFHASGARGENRPRTGDGPLSVKTAAPSPKCLGAAVRKWGRPGVELEQAMIDAGERASVGLRRYIRLFNAVATISPLLGLLGTVFGMMRLFNAISTADAMGAAPNCWPLASARPCSPRPAAC